MGCSCSTNTAVQPWRPEEVNGGQDETESKLDGRGDSAMSKGTTDSGVVMENKQIPVLPGEMPRKLPSLTCERESELDRVTLDGTRQKSSEILEELLNQGIIPVGQRGSTSGEAYTIILDDRAGVSRRPPLRLESLKANKTQSLPSREKFEEKMRLVEKRRKLREDELKTRLRTKSASVRAPAPTFGTEADRDAAITPVERIQHSLNGCPLDPPAEDKEHGSETVDGGRERREEMDQGHRRGRREEGGGDAGRGSEEEAEEQTQVEELKKDQLLVALGELENDSSFQRAEDKEEMF